MAKKIYRIDVKGSLLTMKPGETLTFVTGGEEAETNIYSLRATATKIKPQRKVTFKQLDDAVHTIAIALA